MIVNKLRLLLVDDETAITDRIVPFLKRSGFEVQIAADGTAALNKIFSFAPDLIVLDVLMPRLDGREVLRRVRDEGNWTPIILLTQVGESTERAMALTEGADDYINKPFDSIELVARIRTVLRRSSLRQPPLSVAERLQSGDLIVDRTKRRAYLNAVEIRLSHKAILLLEYMITHPDELLTREHLLDAVWGWDYPIGTRTIDTCVAELRRLLGDDPNKPRYIETVSGGGYRFIGKVDNIG